MKVSKMILIAAFALLSVPIFSQHITESPLTLKRKYAPVFGNTSSVMMMSLCRDYTIGEPDTVYSFQILVKETEKEVTAMSIGMSSFNVGSIVGGSGSAGAVVRYEHQNGAVLMDRGKFNDFYKCINDVYKAAVGMSARNERTNAVCTCGLDGIIFGGEFIPGAANENKFYFKLEDAAFQMSRAEFEEIVKFVRDCKNGIK